jgi:Calcineurin-like phosphoesterase
MAAQPGPGDVLATPPRRIVVAGDWHGDQDWALHVIGHVPGLLGGENNLLILHLGDFGIWPDTTGKHYLTSLSGALRRVGAQLWFVDGNHEDFSQLTRMADDTMPDGRVIVRPNIFHLPRGHRWNWHGREWLACGGGVSLDRAVRTEGRDWWPQEEISDEQAGAVGAGGHADVMVCHDCPSGVVHTFPRPPSWWAPADLERNNSHRERLRRIVDAVQPSHLMHGHLHRGYQRTCDFGYGPVQVTGLSPNGRRRNFAALDLEPMTWWLRGPGLLDLGNHQ